MRVVVGLLLACIGCAGRVEVSRVVDPAEAARAQTDTFEPVAILRGGERIELSHGARIERTRAVLARGSSELYVHKLGAADVIETDDAERIVAIRSGDVVVRFIPGTATSAKDSDEVRGKLAGDDESQDQTTAIMFHENDKIEMHGTFAPGDAIPSGGRVESSRSTGALIAGVVLFTISYAPSAYLASQSTSSWDKSLFIPFAGPWMDLANRPACAPPTIPAGYTLPIDPCIGETLTRVALVASGALQGLGGLFTLFGLPAHSQITDGDRVAHEHRSSDVHVSFAPTGTGVAAFGTF